MSPFVIGNPEFDARLEVALGAFTREVKGLMRGELHALVLGGGYGRGEGGVREADGAVSAYNDFDFFFVTSQRMAALPAGLRPIIERYEARLGVEIDTGRPLTIGDIRAWRPTLMWCELLAGHKVLHGPLDVLTANARHLHGDAPAPHEATRLLLNRAAGLVWARRVASGRQPAPDADFVRRNYYKCAQALGDALLIMHGRWQPRYTGRYPRLRALFAEVPEAAVMPLSLYEQALRFKFRPDALPQATPDLLSLARLWGRVLLHVESHRTGRDFDDIDAYVAWRGTREPHEHRLSLLPRNFVQNLRGGRWSALYPREALYRLAPQLLGLSAAAPRDWDSAAASFLRRWSAFS